MKMEGVQPPDDNAGSVPRSRFPWNKLLLMASVIQGLGLLLSLVYVCLHFSTPQVQHPPIQSINIPLTRCEEDKLSLSTDDAQIMKVQNNSIIISCDGFYLISVKGYFQEEVSISLHYRMGRNPISIPLRKNLQVDFTTVVSLRFKDKVYLNMNSQSTSCENFRMNGGELYLIQQNPGGFCAQ